MSVPVCRSDIRRRIFGVRRVFLWNSLPADVVETTSWSTFKRPLDQFLGERLYETVDGRYGTVRMLIGMYYDDRYGKFGSCLTQTFSGVFDLTSREFNFALTAHLTSILLI